MNLNAIPLSTIQIDLNTAINQQYLGIPTDAEEGMMVKRNFRLRRELDALIDRIVQDSNTQYRNSQDFYHHAVLALVEALVSAGYPDASIQAELQFEAGIRRQAYEAGRLRNLQMNIHIFEEGLDLARRDGDRDSILHYLETFERWLEEAPTDTMRRRIQRVIAASSAVHKAVELLNIWVEAGDIADQQQRDRATSWYAYLEDWTEHDR